MTIINTTNNIKTKLKINKKSNQKEIDHKERNLYYMLMMSRKFNLKTGQKNINFQTNLS